MPSNRAIRLVKDDVLCNNKQLLLHQAHVVLARKDPRVESRDVFDWDWTGDVWGYSRHYYISPVEARPGINKTMPLRQSTVHTNHIESFWNRVKIKFKRMKGCHQSHLPGYLDEFMWRERDMEEILMIHLITSYETGGPPAYGNPFGFGAILSF